MDIEINLEEMKRRNIEIEDLKGLEILDISILIVLQRVTFTFERYLKLEKPWDEYSRDTYELALNGVRKFDYSKLSQLKIREHLIIQDINVRKEDKFEILTMKLDEDIIEIKCDGIQIILLRSIETSYKKDSI